MDIETELFSLKHAILRNAIYHDYRQRWFSFWRRLFDFLVLLGASAAAATILKMMPEVGAWIALAIAVMAGLQLVFDLSGKSHRHGMLKARYYKLASEIEQSDKEEHTVVRFQKELPLIYADEPPTLWALNAIADNRATASLLGGNAPRIHINLFQKITSQLFAFENSNFPESKAWQQVSTR